MIMFASTLSFAFCTLLTLTAALSWTTGTDVYLTKTTTITRYTCPCDSTKSASWKVDPQVWVSWTNDPSKTSTSEYWNVWTSSNIRSSPTWSTTASTTQTTYTTSTQTTSTTISAILSPILQSTTSSTSSTSASLTTSSSTSSTSSPTTSSTTSSSTVSTTGSTTASTTASTSSSTTSSTTSSSTSTTTSSTTSSSTSTTTTSSSTTSSSSSSTSSTITTTSSSSSSSTTTTTTSSTTTSAAPVVTDEAYIDTVLRHHNVHRANHSANAVTWSPSLADTAKSISQTCVYGHNTSANGGGYGQNIGAGYPSTSMGAFITLGLYNSEVNSYTYYGGEPDTNTVGQWGHFSQIVWKATTQVGCYTNDCSAQGLQNAQGIPPYFTVCNYSPAGNVVGAFTQNVGAPIGNPSIDETYECLTAANCVGPTT